MNKKPVLLALLLVVLILLVSACGVKESTDVKSDIIGKWGSDDKSLTLEFTADQEMHSVYDGGNSTNTMGGRIVWVDENSIIGAWEFNITTWEVRIWGDKMQLKSEDGRKITMYRSD